MRSSKSQSGFTLVELLTVIAIIGILVALLMPAVQGAREVSRRLQCANKLKQIALAMNGHVAVHGHFPAGLQVPPGREASFPIRNEQRAPWSVVILPYLEQQTRYDQFDLDGAFDGVYQDWHRPAAYPNRDAQYKPNDRFHCPSDPASQPDSPNSNYLAVSGGGAETEAYATPNPSARCCVRSLAFNNGISYANSAVDDSHLEDGASNVFLIAESKYQHLRGLDHGYVPGRQETPHTWSGSLMWGGNLGNCCWLTTTLVAAVDQINSAPYVPHTDSLRRPWPPRPPIWHKIAAVARGFGSYHPGGCHVAMADGAVHFLSEHVDIHVYRDLGARNDGLPLGGLNP